MLVVIEFMEYKNKENEMNVQIFENKSNAKKREGGLRNFSLAPT